MKYFLLLLIIIMQFSCKDQDERKINLLIENKSNIKIDSAAIHFFSGWTMYYDIKPKEIRNLSFSIKKELIPKGESGVFSICAFKDDYFYDSSAGFIGFYGAKLENEYSFYIWDNGVTTVKDMTPRGYLSEKHKISEFIK